MRSLALSLTFFLLGSVCPFPLDPAHAEVKFFPIPAISTSKNDGNDIGMIVPALITGPDGDLKYLVAPMVVYNSIVGTRGTVNLFRYEPGGKNSGELPPGQSGLSENFLSVMSTQVSVMDDIALALARCTLRTQPCDFSDLVRLRSRSRRQTIRRPRRD